MARKTGEIVFIAGQYASDENGEVVSEDFTEQAERSFDMDHDPEKLETIACRECSSRWMRSQ